MEEASLPQLAFTIDGLASQGSVFGWLFSTINLPACESIRHIPTSRAAAISIWRMLMPAALAGNCFLPGSLSSHTVKLDAGNRLHVEGGSHFGLEDVSRHLPLALRRIARELGALLVPGSVMAAAPGSDVHYAGTLPVRSSPRKGELDAMGQVCGLPGLFVVDGAALPALPAKPHTLTIMANALRIGNHIAQRTKLV